MKGLCPLVVCSGDTSGATPAARLVAGGAGVRGVRLGRGRGWWVTGTLRRPHEPLHTDHSLYKADQQGVEAFAILGLLGALPSGCSRTLWGDTLGTPKKSLMYDRIRTLQGTAVQTAELYSCTLVRPF
eukprot:4064148-Prymnesium_polylepis.1